MAIYSYSESNVIDEVTFRKTENGSLRAYLHAKDGADGAQLNQLRKDLKKQEINSVKIDFEGKAAIEARGFAKEDDLLKLLKQKQAVNGNSSFKAEAADHINIKDKLRKNTMQLGGVFMGAADVGYLIFGALTRSMENTTAGLTYLLGSVTMGAYGRNDQSQKQIREGAAQVLQHAEEQGLAVSCHSDAAQVAQQKKPTGLFQKVHNFITEHPSEVGNTLIAIAGALIAKSAFQDKVLSRILVPKEGANKAFSLRLKAEDGIKKDFLLQLKPEIKQESTFKTLKKIVGECKGGIGDTALGVTTVTAGSIATFMKEKAPDPDQPRRRGVKGIVDRVTEIPPLAIASWMYLVSTAWHGITTFIEGKEASHKIKNNIGTIEELAKNKELLKALPFRAFFVGSSIIGEVLLSMSSKGHGTGVINDKSVAASVTAVAADVVAVQPEEKQEQALNDMAQFLGRSDVLALKDAEAKTQLRQQVASIKKSPWSLAQALKKKPSPSPKEPSSKTAASPDTIPLWTARMDAEPASSLSRAAAGAA